MKNHFILLAPLLILFGLPKYASAQTASIAGTVKDSSGAVVPQAKITVQNKATNASHIVLTDAAGTIGLPLRADADDLAHPLIGLADIDAFGCWDGHSLALGLCETPLGRWTAS